jgi:transcription elongation factor Elf1
MKVRVCPKCEKHNLENAFNCIDCGTTLSIKTLLDTETGEMNVKPLAGEKELTDISMDFEEHVLEILNPVKSMVKR